MHQLLKQFSLCFFFIQQLKLLNSISILSKYSVETSFERDLFFLFVDFSFNDLLVVLFFFYFVEVGSLNLNVNFLYNRFLFSILFYVRRIHYGTRRFLQSPQQPEEYPHRKSIGIHQVYKSDQNLNYLGKAEKSNFSILQTSIRFPQLLNETESDFCHSCIACLTLSSCICSLDLVI